MNFTTARAISLLAGTLLAGMAHADVTPVSSPFAIVQEPTDSSQRTSSKIARAASGNFAVAWVLQTPVPPYLQSSEAGPLYVQLFNGQGQALTAPITVTSNNVNTQNFFVSMNDSGQFIVAWSEGSLSTHVQRYNAQGQAQGPLLNEPISGVVSGSAMNANGDFVLAWSKTFSSALPAAFLSAWTREYVQSTVYVRAYAANGWPKTGLITAFNSPLQQDCYWVQSDAGNVNPGPEPASCPANPVLTSLTGMDLAGVDIGTWIVNAGFQKFGVSMDAAGNFVLAYQTATYALNPGYVYGPYLVPYSWYLNSNRYSAAGTLTAQTQFEDDTRGYTASSTDVLATSTGDFVVTSPMPSPGSSMQALRYSSTGTVESDLTITPPLQNAGWATTMVKLKATSSGDLLAVWQEQAPYGGFDIFGQSCYGQFYGSDGSAKSAPFLIASQPPAQEPAPSAYVEGLDVAVDANEEAAMVADTYISVPNGNNGYNDTAAVYGELFTAP